MVKPSPWSLFKAVKSLIEATHMIRVARINITWELMHKYFFIKNAM